MNMLLMVVTLEISQALMAWLNAVAPLNMLSMLVTLETSQLLMSSLKLPSCPYWMWNRYCMSVTSPVYLCAIGRMSEGRCSSGGRAGKVPAKDRMA